MSCSATRSTPWTGLAAAPAKPARPLSGIASDALVAGDAVRSDVGGEIDGV
jgi:hypothetical protein